MDWARQRNKPSQASANAGVGRAPSPAICDRKGHDFSRAELTITSHTGDMRFHKFQTPCHSEWLSQHIPKTTSAARNLHFQNCGCPTQPGFRWVGDFPPSTPPRCRPERRFRFAPQNRNLSFRTVRSRARTTRTGEESASPEQSGSTRLHPCQSTRSTPAWLIRRGRLPRSQGPRGPARTLALNAIKTSIVPMIKLSRVIG